MPTAARPVFPSSFLDRHSIPSLIDHWAATRPDATFIIDPLAGQELSYACLQQHCRAFAQNLAAYGCAPGDAVAFALANGIDAVRVILGTLYGGFVCTAVNLVAGAQTIGYVLDHADAKLVFVNAGSIGLLSEACELTPHSAETVTIASDWFDAAPDRVAPSVRREQDALLMYTSGTTGVPKGVLHSHASLLAGGGNAALAHQLSHADRGLCVLPLYHINGLCVTLFGTLVAGGSLLMPDRFSVSRFWQDIQTYDCSWFSVVPTQISYLLHEAGSPGEVTPPPRSLRFGRSASAPLAPEVQSAFEARFGIPIIETMGLTETAAQILSNPIDGVRKVGSPGIAYGNEVIIGDHQQMPCAPGVEGEILVRGANVMRGYRNNPEATAAALTRKGWLRTGDLGRMDEDGYVFVTGRLKELIIKGGENIAPREIDEALYTHPDVIEAAAFARPCAYYGQRVEAGVKVRVESDVTAVQLVELCRSRVGAFKAPDFIHILSDLPKGPSGKIQRLKLAALTEATDP